jgi:HPt (histidine-containing phosphotransfer) domain-containing protein
MEGLTMNERVGPQEGHGDASLKPEQQAAQAQTEAQKKLHDLLATLWEQRKNILIERLTTLQQSIANLESPGAEASRKLGAETSHKLAGILGTFGLPRGTDIAREAEVTLEKKGPLSTREITRLHQIAEELGKLLEQRSLPTNR